MSPIPRIIGRAFLENKNDPKPAVAPIKQLAKIYPYEAGGVGTPIAEFLSGKAKFGRISDPLATVFHEGSDKVMNTVPPNDLSFCEMLNEIVQKSPPHRRSCVAGDNRLAHENDARRNWPGSRQ